VIRARAVTVALLFLASCGGGGGTPSPSPSAASPTPAALRGSRVVRFDADDGVHIEGRIFGTGAVAVLLVHGAESEAQTTWFPLAPALVNHGYRVMTINLRGYCGPGVIGCSGEGLVTNPPDTPRDVAAAVKVLRAEGVEKVFAMGASLGAHSVLWAASHPGPEIAGVIIVSAGRHAAAAYPNYTVTPQALGTIRGPKLFLDGELDREAAADAQETYKLATQPKQLVIFPNSGLHGADIFTSPDDTAVPKRATQLLLDFLDRSS
jgi:alpha-beta hydrolase superfamily lysophospholipase